ncbi:MAG: symmetrical bis(5'-nucleosyl)-tetraphosphatase [Natronospirillum sp.]
MALFIMGDVHGCIAELDTALTRISFNPRTDRLWSVGDLVGKGAHSLEVLRLVESFGGAFNMVLGNHELRLLSVLTGNAASADSVLQPVVQDANTTDWADWLRHQPLLLHDAQFGVTMTHAGVFPGWSRAQAKALAEQASQQLRGPQFQPLLNHLYDSPYKRASMVESTELGYWVTVLHAFTQMRYINTRSSTLTLDFTEKLPNSKTPHLVPWFDLWPRSEDLLVFGHWSDLTGGTAREDIRCLDSGCVYGGGLTLLRVNRKTTPA